MKLNIETVDAPIGTPLQGTIKGCRPGSLVEVSTVLKDARKESWTARATFAANAAGTIDLTTAHSLSGTFTGVDSSGLFWSSKPENSANRLVDMLSGQTTGGTTPHLEALSPLEFKLKAVPADGNPHMSQTVVRRRLPSGVRQKPLSQPLYGMLFEPDRPNGAGVIVLGGSEGGVFPARAALLAASGYTTIALAYFDYPGRPKAARDLPISYFRDSLNWLREQADIKKIGLIGSSRGSEAAQLTAITWPESVDALITWVPTHLIHGEINLSDGADFMEPESGMWASSEGPLPGVSFTREDRTQNPDLRADFRTAGGRRYREIYERAWTQASALDFRIPIEKFPGPVLAVGGADDALWPSDLGARRIIEASRQSTRESELLICQSAGHLIGTPGEPRPFPYVMHWSGGYMDIQNGFCAYGGTPQGAAIAAKQSWEVMLEFLRKHLCQ